MDTRKTGAAGPPEDPLNSRPSYVNSHDPREGAIYPRKIGHQARKENILLIIGLCKRLCPIGFEELLSWIEIETGFKRDNAKSILVVLTDTKKIAIEQETGMVFYTGGTHAD